MHEFAERGAYESFSLILRLIFAYVNSFACAKFYRRAPEKNDIYVWYQPEYPLKCKKNTFRNVKPVYAHNWQYFAR